jgi:hypothetical protein
MTQAQIVAISAALVVAAGGGVLLSSGESGVVGEDGAPEGAVVLGNKSTGERGYLADDATGRALLEAALVLRGREPTRIDLFAAEACESGLGLEVFDTEGYASDCLPVGILPAAEMAE